MVAKGVGGGGGGGKQMSCCQVHSPAYFSRLLCMHAHPADAPGSVTDQSVFAV